jgi:hypothetical protein
MDVPYGSTHPGLVLYDNATDKYIVNIIDVITRSKPIYCSPIECFQTVHLHLPGLMDGSNETCRRVFFSSTVRLLVSPELPSPLIVHILYAMFSTEYAILPDILGFQFVINLY